MFPQKKLEQIHRRKRTVVARSDMLREECGEMWSAMGRRADVVEETLGGFRWVRPALSVLSVAGTLYHRRRELSAAGFLGSVCALANIAADAAGKPAPESEPVAEYPELPES